METCSNVISFLKGLFLQIRKIETNSSSNSITWVHISISLTKSQFGVDFFLTMATELKLFQVVQSTFRSMGICRSESNQSNLLNAKTAFFLLSFVQLLCSSMPYLLYEAKSVGERADSFYVSLTNSVCLIYILLSMKKISNILKLIEQFQEFIQKSKLWINNIRE